MADEQHVYHHYDGNVAKISVKVEKNTKGFNYEVSVSDASIIDEAIALLHNTQQRLESMYSAVRPKE